MKLQQLRFLVAVAENGLNITAAAEKLFTSQPGVSKQLRLLEEELGVPLFVRKGKSLESLTEPGKEVVRRATAIMKEVEAISALNGTAYEEETGTLSIGTTHTQARYVLPEVIREFRERYPNVTLDLHMGTTDQLADMMNARTIDFAIATSSTDLFPDLVLLPCYRWDRAVIVPSDHVLAKYKQKLTLAKLAEFPLVTYVFTSNKESSFKRAFREAGLEPDVVFTARDADVIKTYVKMGMGVGVVASMAQGCDEHEGLVSLDGEGLFPRCTTWMGFRKDVVMRRYMYEFMELFAPHLDERTVRDAVELDDQVAVDAQFDLDSLPLKGTCAETIAKAESIDI